MLDIDTPVPSPEARRSDAVLRTGAEVVSKSAVLRSAANAAANAAGRGRVLSDTSDTTLNGTADEGNRSRTAMHSDAL